MSTMKAKQNAKQTAKVSVTLNASPAFQLMFPFGEQAGKGLRAKLEAATALQDAVKAGTLDVSTDDLRKSVVEDAAKGYDAGQANITGKPSSDLAMNTLKSEFRSFILPKVIEHAAAGYALIADIVKGKDAKTAILDRYQQRLEVNRAIKAADGIAPKADLAKRLIKKAATEKTPEQKAAETLESLIADAKAVIEAKAKMNRAQKAAVVALIAAFA